MPNLQTQGQLEAALAVYTMTQDAWKKASAKADQALVDGDIQAYFKAEAEVAALEFKMRELEISKGR